MYSKAMARRNLSLKIEIFSLDKPERLYCAGSNSSHESCRQQSPDERRAGRL